MGSSRFGVLAAPGDPAAPAGTGEATATAAPTSSSAPAAPPVGGGTGLVPAVKPNMNSTGMAGFTDLTNTIAGWALLGSLAAFLLSALVFVIGPALGIRHGRQYGAIGMVGALGAAALVAVAAGLVNLTYSTFGGGS